MNISKTYEKINNYLDNHIYDIKRADNVDGGSVYTTDGYIMYYLPDCSAWTARPNQGQPRVLYDLYNSLFTDNYRRGKAMPGNIGNAAFIKISNGPDGGNTYIKKRFTQLLPAKTDYYTIPEHGQKSPVLAGVYQNNTLHVFAVIMPYYVRNESDFIAKAATV